MKRFLIGGIAVMLMGFVQSGMPLMAEEPTVPVDKTSAIAEFEGIVVTVDLPKQKLHVKDAHGQMVRLQITPQTVISSPTSSKLVLKNVNPNDKVHAYYTTADMKARQIDVSATLPIMKDLESN